MVASLCSSLTTVQLCFFFLFFSPLRVFLFFLAYWIKANDNGDGVNDDNDDDDNENDDDEKPTVIKKKEKKYYLLSH